MMMSNNNTLDTFGSTGFTIFKDEEVRDNSNSRINENKTTNQRQSSQPRKRALKRRMALHDVSNTRSKMSHRSIHKKQQQTNDEMDIEPTEENKITKTNHEFFPTQTEHLRNENKHLQSKIKQLTNQVQSLQHEIFMSTQQKKITPPGVPQPSPHHTSSKDEKHVQLEACLYSVSSTNRVRRTKLGRHASMDTQMKLQIAIEREKHLHDSDAKAQQAATQLAMYVENLSPKRQKAMSPEQRNMCSAYFKSSDFAKDLMYICVRASKHFKNESRLLKLSSPMYVFGDIHGNLTDLHFFANNLWTFGMGLTAGTFLCLGDYVDRGPNGLEVVGYLLAQKVLYPHKIHMLRGNHETRAVNGAIAHYQKGSFVWQCLNRFGQKMGQCVWENMNKVFDRMPLAATVDDDVFCVHGGIPRPINGATILNIDTINTLPSVMGITPSFNHESATHSQVAMDLIWADPATEETEKNGSLDTTGFGISPRGSGVHCYGTKAVEMFLKANGLSYIIRAHEPTKDGIHVSKGARVFTVFSTSKNHGCGDDASCGCILIDSGKISMIHRAPSAAVPSTT